MKDEIILLYERGMSKSELMLEFNIDKKTLNNILFTEKKDKKSFYKRMIEIMFKIFISFSILLLFVFLFIFSINFVNGFLNRGEKYNCKVKEYNANVISSFSSKTEYLFSCEEYENKTFSVINPKIIIEKGGRYILRSESKEKTSVIFVYEMIYDR